jgi:hypothetical protein
VFAQLVRTSCILDLGADNMTYVVDATFDRHFTLEEIATNWHVSVDTIRRLFQDEPGVVVLVRARPGRRTYRTIRIPESVVLRVHRRMQRG